MEDKGAEEMKIEHIGIIVEDIRKSAYELEKTGLGSFHFDVGEYYTGQTLLLGKSGGSPHIELIQVLEGNIPYNKVGFHHIGVLVEDMTQALVTTCYYIVGEARREGVHLVFLDTIKECGYLTELIQHD